MAIGDVAKVDGLAKASILNIDGVTVTDPGINPTAPTSGLLFTYSGGAAAYSVRQLNNNAPYVMRVRRVTGTGNDGNDDEADVKFDTTLTDPTISLDSPVDNFSAGGSNATTLGEFLNVGTVGGTTYSDADSLSPNTAAAYVDAWYDLTGNQNHAEQTSKTSQPQIHNGTADTDLITENGKAALEYNGTSNFLEFPATMQNNFYYSVFGVRQGTSGMFLASQDSNRYWSDFAGTGTQTTIQDGFNGASQSSDYDIYRKNGAAAFTATTTRTQYAAAFYDGNQTLMSFLTDGTAFSSAFTSLSLGAYDGPAFYFDGTMQEFIMYQSTTGNQSSNASGIEENINTKYLIYQPTDAPTSGLLADYTGAAAAYSVRQLSDKAVICMRIRRDMGAGNPGDDDETNIGFDANGDLDTQAIADFCGTGTGYVTRWWDQSVNGNHADQPVGGTGSNTSQPQIYNGTAVIEENGKPAVEFDGSDDEFALSISGLNTNNLSATTVCTSDITSGNAMQFGLNTGNNQRYWHYLQNGSDTMWYGAATPISHGPMGTDQRLRTFIAGSTSGAARSFYNGTEAGTSNPLVTATCSTSEQKLGNHYTGSFHWDGTMQEFIVWGADQYANRTGIETDIMTHFNIP